MAASVALAGPDVAAVRGDVLFQDRERIGGSPMMPLQSAVVGLCLAVFAVTGTSALSAEPQDLSPQDAYLVFNADELGMKLKGMQSWTDLGSDSDFEMGFWTASNIPFQGLLLQLQSLYAYNCFEGPGVVSIRDIIAQNKLFQKQGVEWGKKGSVDNVSGTAEYETFRSGGLHCFVILEYSGACFEPGMEYDKVVIGHYCDRTPTGNSEDTIRAVLSRIGIKGEGIPTKE